MKIFLKMLTESRLVKELRSTQSMPRLRPSGRRLGATPQKNAENIPKHLNVSKTPQKQPQN